MELPFEDESFDVVLCQFGVMFFPDYAAAYREIRRVLRPGSIFLFNIWNSIEQNDFAAVVAQTMGQRYPNDPPVFLARTPYGHSDPAEIRGDVQAAGYQKCHLYQLDAISTAARPDVPAIAFCQVTPLRNEIEARDPGGLKHATEAVTEAFRARFGDGPFEGRISAVVVSAS